MDPSDPLSFNHRTEHLATGHTYHFVDQIPRAYDPAKTTTILCIHGFPDLWYGWRYVIGPWVQSYGWRVVVPDMLGYGGTDKPSDLESYSTKSLCADLAALLDVIGIQAAVIVGHDWGAETAWRFALWHPDRTRALVTISSPFAPRRSKYFSLEQIAERVPDFGYQLYLSDPSSTKEIEKNLSAFFRLVFHSPESGNFIYFHKSRQLLPLLLDKTLQQRNLLLDEKELEYYIEAFKAGGMHGPLNYYRTTKCRFEQEAAAQLATRLPASLPVLFIWGDADRTTSPSQVQRMRNSVPSLQDVKLAGKGHWLMVESKDAITGHVASFLQSALRSDKAKL